MWRLGGLLALLAATTNAQGVPRPTRLRIYEVRTALRFDEGELQRVNFRYDRSSGIKSDIARSLVDCGLTTDRGFVFEVAFFGTEEPGTVKARCHHRLSCIMQTRSGSSSARGLDDSAAPSCRGDSRKPSCSRSDHSSPAHVTCMVQFASVLQAAS